MRFTKLLAIVVTSMAIGSASAQTGGLDRAEAIGKFLDGALPPVTPRPSTGGWKLTNAFPGLTFIDPVQMLPVPYSNQLLVLEKSGRLVVFENDETITSKTVLLDIRNQVESSHDSGMVGLAFHPDFAKPGSPNRNYLYVYYRYTPLKSDTNRAYCRLSRFTWNPATSSIAPTSEYVLINQYDRHNWHNGGGIFFGLDGFLYISAGDEGGANDQYNTGQRRDTGLLAGVLRIDVDRDPAKGHAIRRQPLNPSTPPTGWPNSYSQGYFIPNDNPWQTPNGSQLEEFYAVGLRSPHRMTQDPVTGEIWVGDVGQGTQEEVSLVVRGGNLQWPYREGSVAGPKAKPTNLIGTDVTPIHSYGRSTGSCVIGGYVYRGSLHPELTGKYLFGDHGTGSIWSLDRSSGTTVVNSLLSLTRHGPGPKNGLGSFGIDASGEIYILSLAGTDLDGGRIYRLEKSTEGIPEPPRLLSQTTAFTNLSALTPSAGVLPYDVIQPLWSDGADKKRWIAIPNDGTPNTAAEKIAWSEEGNWSFPIGTVLIKHFEVPGRRLETRFFVNGNDGIWYGFTYRWRPDGTDAELLPAAPLDETFTVNGTTRTWHFPGRNECSSCHTDAAGKVLGVKTRHLNGDYFYETTGRSANQLVTLNRIGFFSPAINEANLPGMLTSRSQDDTTASLERRARSYLDVNCSHCHQPSAPTQAAFDARMVTPPWYQNLINAVPGNNLGISGAGLVRPGNVNLSLIHRRANSLTTGVAMPPIAKNLVDTAGVKLLNDWINSLDPAIGPSGSVPGTAPRDHTPPTLALTRASSSGTNVSGPFEVNLTASESILGLSATDFTVSNGTISNPAGSGRNWSFTVTPTTPGAGSVSITADRITDLNGNANNPGTAPLPFIFQSPAVPGNLLTGGEFENGLTGWDNGGRVTTSTQAFRGIGAASVGTSTFLVRTIPLTSRENYLYTGQIFTSDPGARVEVGLTFWDNNGVWIEDRILEVTPDATYGAFEIAFTAPVNTTTVSVWILTGSSGGVTIDDLAVVAGGPGEPRPQFGPGFTNLLENGGFESGIPPWDTGGQVTHSTAAKSGTRAGQLGADSFFVQTKAAVPGEKIALQGSYFSTGNPGRIEAGFSFWDASGNWITDRTLVLPSTSTYSTFVVDTSIPENSASMTVWSWCSAGGTATFDDLALFRPDEEPVINPGNLFTNGGFETGNLTSWDNGGSAATINTASRTGTYAARLASESFIVNNRAVTPGEEYLFSGYSLSSGPSGAPREAGFSFWASDGQWLGDSIVTLPVSAAYQPFEVRGIVPGGAAACSVWVWSGLGSIIQLDDLRLERSAAMPAPVTSAAAPTQEVVLAARMANLSLKSSRTLDLSGSGALQLAPALADRLGVNLPVYSDGWGTSGGESSGTISCGITGAGESRSLVTTVSGTGVVTARWMLETAPAGATLTLYIDGRSHTRWQNVPGWTSVSAMVAGPGVHTVEFRILNAGAGSNSASASIRQLRFFPGTPEVQPDLSISGARGTVRGRNIYQAKGIGQSAIVASRRFSKSLFRIQWENDAKTLSDGVSLKGTTGSRTHRASYFTKGGNRMNITSAVKTGTFRTLEVAPGEKAAFEVSVAKVKRSGTARFKGTVKAASLLDPSKMDAVRMQSIQK